MAIELFPGKHLFIDDHRIEELTAAKRVLNRPRKHPNNPVLRGEKPWEQQGLHIESFMFDETRGVFRLWYTGQGSQVIGTRVLVKDNPPKEVYESRICYAESDDCVHWRRPVAGVAEYEEWPDNNIVIESARAWLRNLIDDPFEEDPRKRYKMMYLDQAGENEIGGGLSPDQKLRLHAHSPDGSHWTRYPWEPSQVGRLFMVTRYLDVVPTGLIDPDAHYTLYGQRGSQWKTRQIGRRDSKNFIHWSENRPVLESSLSDIPGTEFYHLSGPVINQTYAGLHLGMLGAYYTDLQRPFNPARNDGLTETQLAYSRDSVRWQRWAEPFIPWGKPGAFDCGGVYCRYPAIKENQLYFLYTAESARHGVASIASTALATLRLDGFVSVEAEGFMDGTLTTRPHHWKAKELEVNADAGGGALSVQLQDETGRALEGFAARDCDPIRQDTTDTPITWRGQGDLSSLHDRMVALKFVFSPEVKLYSYTLMRREG